MPRIALAPLVALVFAVACSTPPREPVTDPFFTLPVVAGGAPVEDDLADLEGTRPGYAVEFRFSDGEGNLVTAPRLSMYAGQIGCVSVLNQLSFVSDFDVEVENGAFLADPVIGIYQEGLVLEAAVVPVEGTDRATLAYAVTTNRLDRPIRVKQAAIAAGAPPVTMQLPQGTLARFVGRTLVRHDEFTVLAEGPEGTVVSAKVVPLLLPEPEDGIEALVARASDLPPPADGGPMEISVIRARGPLSVLHVEDEPALRALGVEEPVVLKRFRVRAAPEAGATLSFELQKAFLEDYDVQIAGPNSILDPIVGTVRAGFEARLVETDGEPALNWRYSALSAFGDFGTRIAGADSLPATIELPEVVVLSGELSLRSAVNVMPIARLDGGDVLAVVVRRL